MLRIVATAVVVLLSAATAAAERVVFCAPGYPGTTAEAQPAMDAFAAALASASGRPPAAVTAVYHETESGGLAALAAKETTLAIVPWPFFVKHGATLGLEPRLTLVPKGSPAPERWTLVAGVGRIAKPADLSGYRLVSGAAYAPGFVRSALADWGPLPGELALEPSGSILGALRKAATGEKVALLLDGAQAASLPSLPFARSLEVVARSPEYPPAVLCAVRGRASPETAAAIEAMSTLAATAEGRAALDGLRLDRILPR